MNLYFVNPSEIQKPEIYEVAKHLPKENSVTILQPSSCNPMKCIELDKNIYVKFIPSCFLSFHESRITISLPHLWINELSRAIKSNLCDAIHVCNYDYITAIPPIIVKKRFSIPLVITNDALIGIGNYSFGSALLDLLSGIYTHSVGTRVLKSYDKIVFLYSQLSNEAKKLGVPERKIQIIPNGVDIEKLNHYKEHFKTEDLKKKYGVDLNEKVILYVGRLVKLKRLEIIIKIVEKLIDQGLKVKALIVGEGPQRARLEKIAHRVRGNIVFTGFLSEEKYECYGIADLFILPSLSEGLPSVLLEAASFGLPLVATNTNGIPDIIIHGKTGFLADKWSYDQYINYARLILTDDSLARKLGENARKHVENNFSWNVIAEKYEKLYRDLLAQ